MTWKPECERAFKAAKAMIAEEVLLQYPDHNKPFHVHADASDLQMGAVIMQEEKPVAFFSRKLNSSQRNDTTGERNYFPLLKR